MMPELKPSHKRPANCTVGGGLIESVDLTLAAAAVLVRSARPLPTVGGRLADAPERCLRRDADKTREPIWRGGGLMNVSWAA